MKSCFAKSIEELTWDDTKKMYCQCQKDVVTLDSVYLSEHSPSTAILYRLWPEIKKKTVWGPGLVFNPNIREGESIAGIAISATKCHAPLHSVDLILGSGCLSKD